MPSRRRAPYRILLPLANPRTARDLVRIGSGVSNGRATEITALGIVEVPEGVSLSQGANQARTARRLLQRVLDFGDEERVEIRTMVRISRRAADGVIEAVGEEGTDLVIFGWGGPPSAAAAAKAEAARGARRDGPAVFSPTIDAVVRESPCDIAVVKQRGVDDVRSILVPVRGGPHAELAMRLARDLGKRFGAQVVVLHVVPKGTGERALQREQAALDLFVREHGGSRRVRGLLREATSVRTAIIREAANHDLVVMGASAQPSNAAPDGRFLFGTVADTVASKAKPTVIVVKTKQAVGLATFDELRSAEGTLAAADAYVEHSRSLPTVVDRWFAENTFHASEFRDIARLVELKEKQGLTLSVGLPALNEEKTIGLVIKRIRTALMERMPLIDQLVVIDSDSARSHGGDRHGAGRAGLPAHRHPAGAGQPHRQGRGAVEEPARAGRRHRHLDRHRHQQHPAALRVRPARARCCASRGSSTSRASTSGRSARATSSSSEGGGRVTELMARPLINLFFPELSGIIQPLAGEYAGRRALLESVPFYTGYSVEIGLLIDILEAPGSPPSGRWTWSGASTATSRWATCRRCPT